MLKRLAGLYLFVVVLGNAFIVFTFAKLALRGQAVLILFSVVWAATIKAIVDGWAWRPWRAERPSTSYSRRHGASILFAVVGVFNTLALLISIAAWEALGAGGWAVPAFLGSNVAALGLTWSWRPWRERRLQPSPW